MDILGWMTRVREQCDQWGDYFSLVAGEADPLTAMTPDRAEAWGDFVLEDLGAPGQGRIFALQDTTLRNQIGRAMQAVEGLHERLVAFAEKGEAAEVSAVMLSIDSALSRLVRSLADVKAEDLDEESARAPEEIQAARDRSEEVTPPSRPRPHLQEGSDASGGVSGPPPRRNRSALPSVGSDDEAGRPNELGASPRGAPFKAVSTVEEPVVPLTRKKKPPVPSEDREGSGSGSGAQRRGSGSGARPEGSGARRRGSGSGARPEGSGARRRGSGSGARPEASDARRRGSGSGARPEASGARTEGSGARRRGSGSGARTEGSGARRRGSGSGTTGAPAPFPSPLHPAATDPRVALLSTFVRHLDRPVLGPEEDAALEQILSILSGALAADPDTLSRRLRFLDRQYAAEDEALFDPPLVRDLSRLLTTLAERAIGQLEAADDLAQGDRLLFRVGSPELTATPESLPVVQLAQVPEGLRPGLLPEYLPRLRGPAVGFTFSVAPRAGATLAQRVPENRLELGFIAGATRLWLTALHVLRTGPRGALNIEPGTDDWPAYFEARLVLPATQQTYGVTERFVLAEAARFVDRLAIG